ncbi:MAG: bifunctional hexulose-6-phosphate synthase/ribonuclease regulator [Candidatus Brocadiaceae bacterium]|nr:bifunctional hexulose-6-phosphate synthase/ribonuclease regulator [Candidatus Brocadiaceae bacterium]
MDPVVQLALDFVNLEQALRAAREAYAGGIRWLEAGTPLIKSEGLDAVRALRREFPSATVIADMKVMDAGRVETECAAKAGANVVHVLGAASDATIIECVEAARRYDARIAVDLVGLAVEGRLVERALEVQAMGAACICIHTPIDMQMRGELPFDDLRAVAERVQIPIAVAGGINSETAPDAVKAGASVVIVGGAITKAPDARAAAEAILRAVATGAAVPTHLFKRGDESAIGEVLQRTSAADVTEALHNAGAILGLTAITPGARVAGRALTVWTYPGDWAKPVEAIDQAEEGQVLVIDAGGRPPAVWGEKATLSCLQRKVAGVVIDGAIRDTMNIRQMGFPAFASFTTPVAGEPKGYGMIGIPVRIGGQYIRTGDWIIADDDGVVVIPQEKAVEVANRAQAVVEREEREMAEIEDGRTLGTVSELMRWEQLRKGDGGKDQG